MRHYFDPRAQTVSYRPVKGLLYLLEYHLFGANYAGYHLVQVSWHLANCLLLFASVARFTRQMRLGLLVAILYAGLPVNAGAVIWYAVDDPKAVFFYLGAVGCWMRYLERGERRFYWLTGACTVLSLMIKEIGMTLPLVLFLFDRLLVNHPVTGNQLVRRYLPFALIFLPYLLIQAVVQSNSWFTYGAGNRLSGQVFTNLLLYLGALAFPWSVNTWANWFAVLMVCMLLIRLLSQKHRPTLALLVLAGLINVLPVLGFEPWYVQTRFLYLSAIASVILFAFAFDWIWNHLQVQGTPKFAMAAVLGMIILVNGLGVANATADYAELARKRRVPFNDIVRRHPSLPPDTLLYLLTPPNSPLAVDISGMALVHYGRHVQVKNPDQSERALLRAHNAAYVYYFDETGRPLEVVVSKTESPRATRELPVDFENGIRLNGFEVANPIIKRGNPLVILLYWSAQKIQQDYTVFSHLVDEKGNMISGYDSQPRQGSVPTSAWRANQLVVDSVLILIPDDAPPGDHYRVELGLYELATGERLKIVDPFGRGNVGTLVLEGFRVVE